MSLKLAIPMLLLVWLLAGCGASQGGKWPAPVLNLAFGAITVPAGPLADGEAAEFTASWLNGRAAYTVEWIFDDGADPAELLESTNELMHTAHVTAVNETAAPVIYTGQVTITDMDESVVLEPFTFTVNPASWVAGQV